MGRFRESVDTGVLAHDLGGPGKHRDALRGHSLELDNRLVPGIDPDGADDEIGSLLPGADGEDVAVAPIEALRATGIELHLVVRRDEIRVVGGARLVDAFLVIENGIENKLSNQIGTAVGEDFVVLADAFLVGRLDCSFSHGVGLVAVSINGIVFGHGVTDDRVEPRLDGSINAANY